MDFASPAHCESGGVGIYQFIKAVDCQVSRYVVLGAVPWELRPSGELPCLRLDPASRMTVLSDMAIVPLLPTVLPAFWTRACPIGKAAMFSGTASRRQAADYSWHYRANPWPSPTQAR
jgi:hypothetical protein